MIAIIEFTTLLTSLMMTGLIWFVQLVHYPLFKHVLPENFIQYEQLHTAKTGLLVAPLMVIELLSGMAFWYLHAKHLLNHLALVMLGIVWISTFFIQVPLHKKLAKKYSFEQINRLVQSNWIRTVCWTIRSGCLLFLILFH